MPELEDPFLNGRGFRKESTQQVQVLFQEGRQLEEHWPSSRAQQFEDLGELDGGSGGPFPELQNMCDHLRRLEGEPKLLLCSFGPALDGSISGRGVERAVDFHAS